MSGGRDGELVFDGSRADAGESWRRRHYDDRDLALIVILGLAASLQSG